ncbi:MAG: hypothetical protein NWP47_02930 [Rickettsiaceae bacterium]|nr:hypothetical protein [Rickettsiaceae bacterium]
MQNSKKQSGNSVAVNMPFLLMAYLFTFSIVVFASTISQANESEISEIYIEASGNNKYEAKIRAHEQGMQRALYLLANKFKIPTDGLQKIPYHRIKTAFTPKIILNEISLLEKYSATVTYAYEKGKIFSLLLEYGDAKINELFYETIVLPVFKKSRTLNIWNSDKRWNDFWHDARKGLDAHKIYYPEKTLFLSDKITEANLLELKYEDFVRIFYDKLFKNVMIITAEFFTNRRTGASILHIKKYLRGHDEEPKIIEEEYDLSSWEDIPYIVDLVIDKVIDDYGVLRIVAPEAVTNDKPLPVDTDGEKTIIMNFDAFDEEELNLVISKLEQVPQIDNFAIEREHDNKYKIIIYISVSEYELAEGLYLNGLSYKIHGKLYNLIDIKKGA